MRLAKALATVGIIALCVLIVHIAKPVIVSQRLNQANIKENIERSLGKPSAPVWIVEYIDFQCPSCRTASTILKDYIKSYPNTFFLQVRFHPFESHPHGLRSAIWAECASRQNKFWPFYELVYDKQEDWSFLESIEVPFKSYAASVGLDLKKMETCTEDVSVKQKILDEKEQSKALGIHSTPSFFINGNLIVGPKALKGYLDAYFKET